MNSKVTGISNYKQRILSIEMKTEIVQHVPRINLSHFSFWVPNLNFLIFKFSNFSGSQLLSDFQTFFRFSKFSKHSTYGIPGFLLLTAFRHFIYIYLLPRVWLLRRRFGLVGELLRPSWSLVMPADKFMLGRFTALVQNKESEKRGFI
jgi:hypothetical protein